MPAAVGAVVALAQGASLASIAFQLGASLVLGAISRKIAKRKAARRPGAEPTERRQVIRSSTPPAVAVYGEALTAGALAHIETSSPEQLNMVVALADHECDAVGDIYFDEERVGTRNVNGTVLDGKWGQLDDGTIIAIVLPKLGGADDAGFPGLEDTPGTKWTSEHRGVGVCKLRQTLFWSRKLIDRGETRSEQGSEHFPTGIPGPQAVVRGMKVLDIRTGVVEWSDNPALCLLDVLTRVWGEGEDPTIGVQLFEMADLDLDTWAAEADICDQLVEYRDTNGNTVTGKRYRLNGTISLDGEPADILEALLSSCGGSLYIEPGPVRLMVAAPRAVTGSVLTADDLAGSLKVRPRRSVRDAVNVVRGTWVDEKDLWRVKQFTPVRSSIYQTQDDGLELAEELKLDYTTQEYIARRLAKIELEQARQEITFTTVLKPKCIDIIEGDVRAWTIPELGWSAKPFVAVQTSIDQYFQITVTWQEYADVYDFAPDEELESDPAPNTALVPIIDPGPPGRPQVEESLFVAREAGGVRARVTLSWAPPEERDIAAVYRVRYRVVGATAWETGPVSPELTAEIVDLPPGIYDFAVRGEALTGTTSPWSTTRRQLHGLTARPAVPTGITLSTFAGTATLGWDRSPDLDVRVGGSFVLRHSSLTSGATWADGITIAESIPGNATQCTVPSRTGTYMLRSRDSGGRLCEGKAAISTNDPSVIAWTPIATVNEHPGFTGVKVGCGVDASVLKVDVVGNVSTWADFGAVASVAQESGARPAASYTFQNRIDLGTVQNIRLLASVSPSTVLHLTTIGARGLPISRWDSFGGVVDGDEADARVEIRFTEDDPGASPTWSDWRRADGSELRARAVEGRLVITTVDHAYRWGTSALTLVAYGVS